MGASDARHVPFTCATNAVQGAECEFETAAVRLRHAARQCDGAEAGRGRSFTKLGSGHSHRSEEGSE